MIIEFFFQPSEDIEQLEDGTDISISESGGEKGDFISLLILFELFLEYSFIEVARLEYHYRMI